ncbi:MAG: hypothetical protein WC565_07630 [Parcubacteria group bacterium]
MDSVKYQMEGDHIHVTLNGVGYHYPYDWIQRTADIAQAEDAPDAWVWQGALRFMRDNLAVTPGGELVSLEQANAKYAVDTNTAWAAMGIKGGAM